MSNIFWLTEAQMAVVGAQSLDALINQALPADIRQALENWVQQRTTELAQARDAAGNAGPVVTGP